MTDDFRAEGEVTERNVFLETAVKRSRLAMIASDVSAAGEPIIFANEAFEDLTGYTQAEILGRSCRFLQGEKTCPATVEAIRVAIADRQEGYFEILNYRKDGTSFWNGVHLGPASEPGADKSIFFGSQRDVTLEVETRRLETARLEELRHRMGNLMAIVGIVIKNSNEGSDVHSMQNILQGRIAALGAATELIYPQIDAAKGMSGQSLEPKIVDVDAVVRTIMKPLGCDDKISMNGPPTPLPEQQTTNLSLVIHELSTNAGKHGALAQADGRVSISWRQVAHRVQIDWVETGCVVKIQPDRKGLGRRLLENMVNSSQRPDACLSFESSGVVCKFDVPHIN